MAKSNKNIGAFQKAMLSNTKMIRSEENEDSKKDTGKAASKKRSTASGNSIDQEAYAKIDALAKKYGLDTQVLIGKSLDLFISLEDFWFDNN